jgi:uncharacterized membrane protein YgcG
MFETIKSWFRKKPEVKTRERKPVVDSKFTRALDGKKYATVPGNNTVAPHLYDGGIYLQQPYHFVDDKVKHDSAREVQTRDTEKADNHTPDSSSSGSHGYSSSYDSGSSSSCGSSDSGGGSCGGSD